MAVVVDESGATGRQSVGQPRPFRLGLFCGWLTDGEKKRCGTKLAEVHVNGTAHMSLAACPRCGARNEFEWGTDGVRLVKVVPAE